MEMGVPVSLQPLFDVYLHALEPWYAHKPPASFGGYGSDQQFARPQVLHRLPHVQTLLTDPG
jgi:hypothetical protein